MIVVAMMKKLEYADCSRLNGANAVYVVANGKAVLKVDSEEFQLGTGAIDQSMRKVSSLLKSRGIGIVDYKQDGETAGRLRLNYPDRMKDLGAYVLFLLADDGETQIILSAGVKPRVWPEKVTADVKDLDYFKCRILDGKAGVYYVNHGFSRLECDGQIYDCGPCSQATSFDDIHIGKQESTEGMSRSLVGRVCLSVIDDSYVLALNSVEGEIALIKNGSIQQELDKL